MHLLDYLPQMQIPLQAEVMHLELSALDLLFLPYL